MKKVDLTGKRFGKLLVIQQANEKIRNQLCWICKCDCGNTIVAIGNKLKSNRKTSCGCDTHERLVKSSMTHGLSSTPIYKIYSGIVARCLNPKVSNYHRYGGRGIEVCKDWIGSGGFERFYAYVSSLEHFNEKGYSIDRINNDGNYEPGNIKYSTRTEQSRNRRTNRAVYMIDKEGRIIREFAIMKDAGDFVKGNPTNIMKCCKGEINTAYGYKWKYKQEG